VFQVQEYYEIINIVYIHEEKVYGTVDQLGAFASLVKYKKDGIEQEVLLENDEFAIVDEIVFHHVEEDNG
jgi:hypothetical protein